MKAKKIVTRARILSGITLLLLIPAGASAQTLIEGWYKVKADELSVRDNRTGLVMGTLTIALNDRFYIRYVDPKTRNAWGVADGGGFKGCGWIVTRYRPAGKNKAIRRSVERDINQTGRLPSCRTNENSNRKVDRKHFAARFSTGKDYTNDFPTGDGSKAFLKVGDFVYGNYDNGSGRYDLELNDGRQLATKTPDNKPRPVYWRYFTRDQEFVMVRYGGTGKRGSGLWGFIRCTILRPAGRRVDIDKFTNTCDKRPRP
jgi:hypothetical protein